jgi:hypothetical protein
MIDIATGEASDYEPTPAQIAERALGLGPLCFFVNRCSAKRRNVLSKRSFGINGTMSVLTTTRPAKRSRPPRDARSQRQQKIPPETPFL